MCLLQARKLVIKVLSKTMDSTTLSPEKVELATLARDEEAGRVSGALGTGLGRGWLCWRGLWVIVGRWEGAEARFAMALSACVMLLGGLWA